MARRDVIVIGASAGGIEALRKIVRGLPADLPAAVIVAVHIWPKAESQLPGILSRAGALPAVHAAHGMPIERSRVYVAPPDQHLLVQRGHLCLARGAEVSLCRPSVDPLFCTAARIYGPRVVGVLLSGNLDDGTAGLLAIKLRRGVTIVQDPDEALYPDMPASAIQHVGVDHILPATAIAPLLVDLAWDPVEAGDEDPAPELGDPDRKLVAPCAIGKETV
jgi:two-component system chemotaxis response regulator CheB